LARARNRGYKKWLEAREARDYQVFRPALETTYELMLEVVDIIGYEDHPLDALVEEHEPGMTTAEVEALFDELRDELVPLAQAIFEREDAVEDSVLHQEFESEIQLAAARAAVEAIGFDLGRRGRLDTSVHPFSTSFSPDDVRITTRVDEDFLGQSFFAALHEAGHGTYMQGIPIQWERSILGSGASAGLHEAQSRLWENIVGRSQEFWEYFFPQLQKFFPTQLSDSTEQELYRAVNRVKPSFIRVEADEVTYNLHIMIRFELEKAVFDGELDLNDLASAWNEKYEEYLGICPPDDLVGVLQDIHWSGSFGASFQSYTIGNVASVQLYDRALSDNPDLPEQFRRGNFSPLLEWMNRNVHDKGAKFEPQELLERSTGACLTVRPYLDYLKTKFGELYKL
jgi:carboxypeptidase Taq